MRKFCCAHCGHRLAVPPRHLDKLVTCPECGQATHPLAVEILSATGVAAPGNAAQGGKSPVASGTGTGPATPEAAPAHYCANCTQPIGRLQKLNLWQNSVVCAACYRRLSKEGPEAAVKTVATRAGSARPDLDVRGETNLPTRRRNKSQPAASALVGIAKILPSFGPLATPEDAGLRTIPMQLRQRALVVLAAVCIGGAAVYGALSLLRDLTGILTSIALVVTAGVVAYLVVQALVSAGRRALRRRRTGAKDEEDVVIRMKGEG